MMTNYFGVEFFFYFYSIASLTPTHHDQHFFSQTREEEERFFFFEHRMISISIHSIRLLAMENESDWPRENPHYDWLKVVKRSRKKKYIYIFSLSKINNCRVENRFFLLLLSIERERRRSKSFFSSPLLFLSFSLSR